MSKFAIDYGDEIHLFLKKLKSKAKKEDYLIILTFDLNAFF